MIRISLSIAFALGIALEASADEPVTLAAVSVQDIRDPQQFDLPSLLAIKKRYESVSPGMRGLTELAFYATGKHAPLDLSTLRLDLEGDEVSSQVEVQAAGKVVLPPLQPWQADRTTLVANVPRGSLDIIYKVNIVPPTDQPLTLGYLRAASRQSRAAWKRTYNNKLAGLSVPAFTCAKFEFSDGQPITVVDNQRILWSSPTATTVEVPLTIAGASDRAIVHWDPTSLIRIGSCKLKRT